jgi:hypothetical protein
MMFLFKILMQKEAKHLNKSLIKFEDHDYLFGDVLNCFAPSIGLFQDGLLLQNSSIDGFGISSNNPSLIILQPGKEGGTV